MAVSPLESPLGSLSSRKRRASRKAVTPTSRFSPLPTATLPRSPRAWIRKRPDTRAPAAAPTVLSP